MMLKPYIPPAEPPAHLEGSPWWLTAMLLIILIVGAAAASALVTFAQARARDRRY